MTNRARIGCVVALLASRVFGFPVALHAQIPLAEKRLTVRPREAATGTRNAVAGEQTLDALGNYLLYVPKEVLGTRRVPLVVMLGGGGVDSHTIMDLDSVLAGKYGMILLAPDIGSQSRWIDASQVKDLDRALKQVLRTFAIDPTKIALVGSSRGGHISLELGCENPTVFSRVGPISPVPYEHSQCDDTHRPVAQRTPYFLTAGIAEDSDMVGGLLTITADLRRDGHLVRPVLSLRPHQMRLQDHDDLWRWLKETWATPTARTILPQPLPSDPMPILTTDVVTRLITFWRWMNESAAGNDSMRPVRKERTILLGTEPVTVFEMKDVATLAAKAPSVRAKLDSLGFTARQEEQYYAALISAQATRVAKQQNTTLALSATLTQNIAFIVAHEPDVNALFDAIEVPHE